MKTDQKDAALIRYCVGYEFNETAKSLETKSLVRQRNSLANWILKLSRQLDDIEYKQACLGENLPECYSEIKGYLEGESKELEKKLQKKLQKQQPELQKLLRTIPGVGPLTAVAFISEVGDIKRFDTAKQLCAYAGIDPRVHESGTSVRGKGYISKRGSKILRTRLYNACSVAVLRPNMFQVFFQKKISEGKPYKVALVATINKMTQVIFSVWTNNKPFVDYVFKPKKA